MKYLQQLLEWALSNGGQRVLSSLGIFIGTGAFLVTLSDAMIDLIIQNFDNLAVDSLAILNLMGFDAALSYILSAIATKAVYESYAARVMVK